MNQVANVLFQSELATSRFACDTASCRGACCTMPGGRGAPLEEAELAEMQAAIGAVRKYLPAEHVASIDRNGLSEGMPGTRTTPCIDEKACVFSYTENGIARCGFERAYLQGETSWRKPLSCHLFPVRVRSSENDILRYEQIGECGPGRDEGKKQNTYLHEFLRVPLIRKFGEAWYEEFSKTCKSIDQQPSRRGS
ncbi:MAG: DUF3109 family protein [Ignavibacteria bacterium]|nr:DUF3109 family protein [Ignavibacteria bacterium]